MLTSHLYQHCITYQHCIASSPSNVCKLESNNWYNHAQSVGCPNMVASFSLLYLEPAGGAGHPMACIWGVVAGRGSACSPHGFKWALSVVFTPGCWERSRASPHLACKSSSHHLWIKLTQEGPATFRKGYHESASYGQEKRGSSLRSLPLWGLECEGSFGSWSLTTSSWNNCKCNFGLCI